MSSLIQDFDDLLSHLNSEENDMALALRQKLCDHLEEQGERLEKLDALEAHGVDNWEGYDLAMSS